MRFAWQDGWTALHIAASRNHMKTAQWLVEEGGADVEAKNDVSLVCCWSHLTCSLPGQDGETALQLAEKHGCKEVAEWLKARNAKEQAPKTV